MGLFGKKKGTPIVGMRGFSNGKEVVLKKDCPGKIPPLEYYQTIEQYLKPIENVMVSYAVTLQKERSKESRITLLQALVESFYDLKEKCAALGPEYAEYFSDTWEHCHNSRSPDFCYVDRFESELCELQREAGE